MHIETLSLREVIVFLVAAGVVVPLGHRLKISPVLGFLVVGLVIGPSPSAFVSRNDTRGTSSRVFPMDLRTL